MRRSLPWILLFTMLTTSFSGLAWSEEQNPSFNYQGFLRLRGQPVTDILDLTFRLFDAPESSSGNGVQIGDPVSLTGVSVVDGRFSADLSFPGAFDGGQYWLEISVGGDVLSPRQPIRATPVALYALDGNPGPEGPQGPQGETGPAGDDGLNTLLVTTMAPEGGTCAAGGVKVETGLDADNSGQLDETEINDALTRYICNGVQGETGLTGPAGPQGEPGLQGETGPEGPMPTCTTLRLYRCTRMTSEGPVHMMSQRSTCENSTSGYNYTSDWSIDVSRCN